MTAHKHAISGNAAMLVLKSLETKDMYGYQIIEELAQQSKNLFQLKTGTLYPILHGLEHDGMVISYDENADSLRIRKYYQITDQGKKLLQEKKSEWRSYADAVDLIMEGCVGYVFT